MPRMLAVTALSATALTAVAGCATALIPASAIPGASYGERGALVLDNDHYGDRATRVVYLDQNWGRRDSEWFYHADQGSVLMPYDVFTHLEVPGGTERVASPRNLARFRMLNQQTTRDNPDGLPVGLARHEDRIGFTCAGCHTSQVNYQGTAIRVDGAPALVNMIGLFGQLHEALKATLADEAKLNRYAASLPGGGTAPAQVDAARKSLQETLDWFDSYMTANRSTTVEGFARLDAIGRIVNQCIRFTSDPKNSIEPNAPTSFPLLWDIPRHDYVQWTGFAPNAGAGSLFRNTGEVVGVFGRIDVQHYETEEEAKKGYPSTVNSGELVAMEETLRRLQSPVWPEGILGSIDRALAKRGEALYQANCQSCHALLKRDDPQRKVTAWMVGVDKVGTDDTSIRNLLASGVPSGKLEGAYSKKSGKYGKTMGALELVADVAVGALTAHKAAAALAVANAKLHGLEESEKQGDYTKASDADPAAPLRSYKARPLNGTWASSPYLHNGSVPTLYHLLLPAAQRPARFAVGRLEYDPKKVGYVSDGEEPFVLDVSVTGNSNRGHEYGTNLSDEERWALVEYLKTL